MEEGRMDRFGFLSQEKSATKAQRHRDNARLEKWQEMLIRWDFELRSRKQRVKLRIRKGIPDCLRGKVWFDIAGVQAVQMCYPADLYSSFTQKETPAVREEEILRDIHRTFPNHVLFREASGRNTLFRVLRAYSLFDPEIGYCQGMGALAGTLLMYVDEEKSFWTLATLMQKYSLKGFFISGLSRTYRTLYIACRLIDQFFPRLHGHLLSINLSPTLFLPSWIMSHFTTGFLPDVALRIWDCFFSEGEKIWFRVILAVMEKAGKVVITQGMDDAIKQISVVAMQADADDLLKCAFRFRLSKKRIAELDQEYADSGRPEESATW